MKFNYCKAVKYSLYICTVLIAIGLIGAILHFPTWLLLSLIATVAILFLLIVVLMIICIYLETNRTERKLSIDRTIEQVRKNDCAVCDFILTDKEVKQIYEATHLAKSSFLYQDWKRGQFGVFNKRDALYFKEFIERNFVHKKGSIEIIEQPERCVGYHVQFLMPIEYVEQNAILLNELALRSYLYPSTFYFESYVI